MDVSVSKPELFRVILAGVISPTVPILALSIAYWNGTGSKAWFPIFFIFGYFFFFLIGLPIVGILLNKRTVLSCAIGGGCVSIAPILLLDLFSLFSKNNIFTFEMVLNLGLLFIAGCVGGALFWLIAFSKKTSRVSELKTER